MPRCLRPERFYDYLIIDNAPGIGKLQESAIIASHEIFVPTGIETVCCRWAT